MNNSSSYFKRFIHSNIKNKKGGTVTILPLFFGNLAKLVNVINLSKIKLNHDNLISLNLTVTND